MSGGLGHLGQLSHRGRATLAVRVRPTEAQSSVQLVSTWHHAMPPQLDALALLAKAGSKEFVRDVVAELYRLRDAAAFPQQRCVELCEVLGAEPAEVQQMFAAGKFVVRECARPIIKSESCRPAENDAHDAGCRCVCAAGGECVRAEQRSGTHATDGLQRAAHA